MTYTVENARMADAKKRLLEAEQALRRLELQIEQYEIHLAELSWQRNEAEKAQAVITRLNTELEWQRKYCRLLANAVPTEAAAINGSRVA